MVVVITKTIFKNLRQKLKELRDHKRFSSWKTSLAHVAGGRLKGHVPPRIFQKWNCKIHKFSVSNTKCLFSKLAFDNFLKTTKIQWRGASWECCIFGCPAFFLSWDNAFTFTETKASPWKTFQVFRSDSLD